ncbi:MAG: glycoside hydrolase family 13 protein [Pygmaiobacter massiliensis]|nr:glycoside hydrolase family 13 protein [Pygmaiobacter massiliensis]
MSVYNSYDSFHKTPFGAVKAGSSVTFRLKVPKSWGNAAPRLYLSRKDGSALLEHQFSSAGSRGEDNLFQLTITAQTPGAWFYWFDLWVGYTKVYQGDMGEGICTTGEGRAYQLTVYSADFKTPDWLKGGTMYQIFPDRFCEGHKNKPMPFADRIPRQDKDGEPYFWPSEEREGYLNLDYYGGDFEGIRQKLDYLVGLGVNCIYLNPIFEAHSNHRYNTADYMKPDPLLGTEQEFSLLCAQAREKGIRIILDGVFSHTGSDSIYFDKNGRYGSGGAYHNPHSPYRCWYDFGPQYPCGYRSWWGFETLPEVNESEPSYRQFICGEGGVIDHWIGLGASGFRLDVADELPDDFIAEIRKAVKRNGPDCYLLGEVWEDASCKVSYNTRRTYLLGGGLDSVMNYPFCNAIIDFARYGRAERLASRIMEIVEHYPPPAMELAMNFLSTHDTVRAITAIAGEDVANHDRYWQSHRRLSPAALEQGKQLLQLCYALLFFLPGVPCIYYGDEIAMQGYKDPFNRAFYEWDCTDNRLRNCIRKLSALRRHRSQLKSGALRFFEANGDVIGLERYDENGRVLLLVNRGSAPVLRRVEDVEICCGGQDFSIQLLDVPKTALTVQKKGPFALAKLSQSFSDPPACTQKSPISFSEAPN